MPMPVSRTAKRSSTRLVLRSVPDRLDRDEDLSRGGELDRVAQEVDQDLAQPRGVALDHGRHRGIDPAADLQPLARRLGGEQVDRLLHAGAQGERGGLDGELAGLDLREVQNVVEQGEQRLAAAADRLQVFALLGGERGAGEDAGHADDRVHRRADLVAHVGQELALEPVGAVRLLLGRARLLLRPLELLDRLGEAPGSLPGFGFGEGEALGALPDELLQPPGAPLQGGDPPAHRPAGQKDGGGGVEQIGPAGPPGRKRDHEGDLDGPGDDSGGIAPPDAEPVGTRGQMRVALHGIGDPVRARVLPSLELDLVAGVRLAEVAEQHVLEGHFGRLLAEAQRGTGRCQLPAVHGHALHVAAGWGRASAPARRDRATTRRCSSPPRAGRRGRPGKTPDCTRRTARPSRTVKV